MRVSATYRTLIASALLMLSGCGGLPVIPDDCAFFSRAEALAWYANAQQERNDGSTKAEAIGEITIACAQDRCDGSSGGVCAVSCAACADALVTIAYE